MKRPKIPLPGGVVVWNVLFAAALALMTAVAGEIYLRWSKPFMKSSHTLTFVTGVGLLHAPKTEVRATNGLDFWTVSQANSLGFLDREPLDPKRAEASCHISVIGDSFVMARQVPIADKIHVRLEDLAREYLPALNISTSAFGRSNTAQASQLPYYDRYAKKLSPKLLVLVFTGNDFGANSATTMSLRQGWDPARMPYAYLERTADGMIELLAPSLEYCRPWCGRMEIGARSKFFFATWLHALLEVWQHVVTVAWSTRFASQEQRRDKETLDLDFTAFALQQFKKRSERDKAALLILSEYYMGSRGDPAFDRLSAVAEASGIPVISLHDYLIRRGRSIEAVHWRHDRHWNATGHQWAAEALLEYLRRSPETCATQRES